MVLTAGTFLAGQIHVGDQQQSAGRAGCASANRLSQQLRALDLGVGRLKTGTPPRIDGRSLDYTKMREQPGDQPTPIFLTWVPEPCTRVRSVVLSQKQPRVPTRYSRKCESLSDL